MSDKPEQVTVTPEWSYPVEADSIEEGTPYKVTIEPDAAEKKALAQRLNVLSVDDLRAELTLDRNMSKMVIHVTGSLKGQVTQACVVSLEPVTDRIEDTFEAWFAEKGQAVSLARARADRRLRKGHAEIPILEESEDQEPIVEGRIDLGELATQYFSLAINPYPHAPGVSFEHGDDREKKAEASRNPFAALKEWKDRQKQWE